MSDRSFAALVLVALWTFGAYRAAPPAWRRYRRLQLGDQLAVVTGLFVFWALAGRNGFLVLILGGPVAVTLFLIGRAVFRYVSDTAQSYWRRYRASSVGFKIIATPLLVMLSAFILLFITGIMWSLTD